MKNYHKIISNHSFFFFFHFVHSNSRGQPVCSSHRARFVPSLCSLFAHNSVHDLTNNLWMYHLCALNVYVYMCTFLCLYLCTVVVCTQCHFPLSVMCVYISVHSLFLHCTTSVLSCVLRLWRWCNRTTPQRRFELQVLSSRNLIYAVPTMRTLCVNFH